ncbi:organic cation/carnitine transporter 3 [Ziziphus jujuba]|uniref:Organic cation/carnitine transporter 3 n=2 Tax=Ziziphus jujuba TaxID=326968 RepID=A0A6P4AMQ7_ZIZJJ|nr:organic cation/carnitine transporter 3 [Ziziphus jujuba]KAH7536664.1 hypothetical protein FEM48_Zijuj03G0008500 [Ziziphus jujuba var. spinosa]
MADSSATTPLLVDYDSANVDPQTTETTTSSFFNLPPTSLDSIIEKVTKNSGFAQFLQAILVSLSWLFDGQQSFISIYADAQPTWHCTATDVNIKNSTCNPSSSNICQLSSSSWAWDRPPFTTTISDFNLQCSSSIVSGLPASAFFFGCLLGGFILATLGDSSLGRKNLLFLSSMTMSVSALLTSFAGNVWIYSALRFASGFGRASIGGCALVLSTEMVSRKWRGQVGIIGFFCFTLGFLSLPWIAYVNRNSSWRVLYLWTSVPGILYCALIFFFVSESPKWLFSQGRNEEAVASLERFGEPNKSHSSSLNLYLSRIPLVVVDHRQQETPPSFVDHYASLRSLFSKRWAFRRLLTLMVLSIGIGMIYYGMPLGVGNLGFDTYLSVVFNALSEIPCFVITFFFIGRWNRKPSVLAFSLISGVCSILCVLAVRSKWVQIGLELASFFCGNTAFSILLIYTLELFPTSVRNSATSMVRQALVFGGMFSPVLISAGRDNEFLSYGVFGIVTICCGLSVFSLPETRGESLCDTMDEQERKANATCGAIDPNATGASV